MLAVINYLFGYLIFTLAICAVVALQCICWIVYIALTYGTFCQIYNMYHKIFITGVVN